MEFEQIGCDKDHVHLLCTAHPKIARGQIVRVFKSITARELFKRKPDLKRDLWGGEFWTDGYYVATVGERADWVVVERYVKNQKANQKKSCASLCFLIPRGLAAGLFILRTRKGCVDSIRKSLETIDTSNQNIFYATVLKFREHIKPEFGAFIF